MLTNELGGYGRLSDRVIRQAVRQAVPGMAQGMHSLESVLVMRRNDHAFVEAVWNAYLAAKLTL